MPFVIKEIITQEDKDELLIGQRKGDWLSIDYLWVCETVRSRHPARLTRAGFSAALLSTTTTAGTPPP
ncbi:hypothetical protein [Kluyvera sichuanensis]|uniref:hypothetical protein n=1 Tax=Kluyvera sichuanensis TaxID=2725494 RepID=UPI0034A59BD6